MFYDIFEDLCKEIGITPTAAARDNGIAQGVVSMWKKRGSFPNAPTLVKLAEYFHTTPAYLMGNKLAKDPFVMSEEEKEHRAKLASTLERRGKEDVANSIRADVHMMIDELNDDGVKKASEFVEVLYSNPQYVRKEAPPAPEGTDGEQDK